MKVKLKWALLAAVFIGVFLVYLLVMFRALTWVLEYLLDAKVYWQRTPFLQAILYFGVGLFVSIVCAAGIRNLLDGREFLAGIEWKKLIIVLFCLSMFFGLLDEAERLVPGYTYEDNEEAGPLFWQVVLAIVLAVGYAMWPKKRNQAAEAQNRLEKCIQALETLAEDTEDYAPQEHEESPADHPDGIKERIESIVADLRTLDEC